MQIGDITLVEYRHAVRSNLREGKLTDAFLLLRQAIVHYPENPYILSYFGFLQAVIEKRYRSGVDNCRKAIALMQQGAGKENNRVPAELFLNLGRAYIAAGRRKEAVDSLERGLKHGRSNDLLNELRGIGIRRKPVLPFLDRSNPINKYIGMMLYMKNNDRVAGKAVYAPAPGGN